jgi:hypothetical protein
MVLVGHLRTAACPALLLILILAGSTAVILNSALATKKTCLGISVPGSWSVFENMPARDISTGGQDLRRGANRVFCSIAPDKITFGDGSFSQIDFSIVQNSYVENQLELAAATEARVVQDEQWSKPGWRIEYPVDADGPSKEATGGTTWYISIAPGKWLSITKWALGGERYETEVRAMIRSLDFTDFTN